MGLCPAYDEAWCDAALTSREEWLSYKQYKSLWHIGINQGSEGRLAEGGSNLARRP